MEKVTEYLQSHKKFGGILGRIEPEYGEPYQHGREVVFRNINPRSVGNREKFVASIKRALTDRFVHPELFLVKMPQSRDTLKIKFIAKHATRFHQQNIDLIQLIDALSEGPSKARKMEKRIRDLRDESGREISRHNRLMSEIFRSTRPPGGKRDEYIVELPPDLEAGLRKILISQSEKTGGELARGREHLEAVNEILAGLLKRNRPVRKRRRG
ncbi:MAG: hypothetical protein V1835_00860 [Candidatus Micrarchaeota archaeon]